MDGGGAGTRYGWDNYSRKTSRICALWLLMITALTRIRERSQLWGRGQEEAEEEGAPRGPGSVAGLGRGDALRC